MYANAQRQVLSRNYLGLGIDMYAPYQRYPGENISVRVRIEALEDVKNVSVTLFIWGSKSNGYAPWGTSFILLDVEDFPNNTVQDETYTVEMHLDLDPGLVYGILYLDWSIYRSDAWEHQWEKASIRLMYINNKHYEDLQATHNSILTELRNTKTLMYVFGVTTATLLVATLYLIFKKKNSQL
jgi:hypothetical protein